MEHFFSRNSSGDRRSDANQSQSNVDHIQIIWGDTVKLLGGIYLPHIPPGFGTPDCNINYSAQLH